MGSATYDLHSGRNQITWELKPLYSARLLLRDGPRDVPCPSSVRVSVKKKGEEIELERRAGAGGALIVQVSGAGSYEVAIASVEGFRDPPPLVIELTAGRVKTVVVPLERAVGRSQ